MEGHSHEGSIMLDTVKPKTFYWSSIISPYSIACLSKNTGTKTDCIPRNMHIFKNNWVFLIVLEA